MKFIRFLFGRKKRKRALLDAKKSLDKSKKIEVFFKENPKLEKEFDELVDSWKIFEKYKWSGIKCSTYIINIERQKFYEKYSK